MSYTPGPWYVNAIDSKRKRIVGDETSSGWDKIQINSANNTIATVYHGADARLIAAAPALLGALRDVRQFYQGHFDSMPVAFQTIDGIVDAAIAKAEGRGK